jgi:streptogramin lyase/mono/diheme cytochrome c family protein
MRLHARLFAAVIVASLAAIAGTALRVHTVNAAGATGKAAAAGKDVSTNDDFQRSAHADTYTLMANSGPSRGENIYFYKCWMCHNKYAKGGPYLKELFKQENLVNGEPVSEDSVTQFIKDGAAGMPSFKTTLSDTQVADVVSYIKQGKCCAEGEDLPKNPWYRAEEHPWPVQNTLHGGATGVVKIGSGDSPEGIGVQLIAPNGIRTTVYTNIEGKFEFPAMKAGTYTLRIPTPLMFKPYLREAVNINGATKLDEIVLDRVSKSDALPATPEIQSQLSSAELLFNIPGTAEEKSVFQKNCSSCHSWQQVFRNHYDQRSWTAIVDRMTHFSGTSLVVRVKLPEPGKGGYTRPDATSEEEVHTIINWLSRVRGPDSKDENYRVFPRPEGESTKVVVTEYELPQYLLQLHDAQGDAQGNIWFSSHKTRWVGKLDPKTGIVKEYAMPLTPGAMPGTHALHVDKKGIIWFSENWGHNLDRLDPTTGHVTQVKIESPVPLNAPGFGNFAMTDDGFVWDSRDSKVRKIDSETGKIVKEWPLQLSFSYDSLISADQKYWAGGSLPAWGNTAERLDIQTGEMVNANTGEHMATAKRGGFGPDDNAWFGGGAGALVQLDAKAGRIREYWPPTAPNPLTDFYEAMPDKNNEIWAGVLHGRQMVRLNPKTESWKVYQMPEPFSYDRRTWIDSSTNPVTVWYVDYNGYLVRVQPRD